LNSQTKFLFNLAERKVAVGHQSSLLTLAD
jgi:hypothetical protein